MAERKLDFNAPLLSTRRMQKSAVSVRRNKTFNFGHVPKTDDDSSSLSVLVSEMDLDHVTEAVSVPFTWEQAPGRLKCYDFRPQEVFKPCLPPGKVMDILKCPAEKPVVDKQFEESEDEEDVFSDARDTLSLMDSSSINHSLSGVSGYGVVETKTQLNFPEDPKSRGYMLNRFLPAAKAMTVEQPRYASNRKPSTFIYEPTMQMRELVPEEKRQSPRRYIESVVSPYHYHQDSDDEKSEKDDEDDEVSGYAYLSKRGCGMLPQFCFKDSLGMLKAVPGVKAKHHSLTTSASHDQVKSSKVAQLKSRFQSVKKMALDSVSKHKLAGKIQSPVHPSVGKKFDSESNVSVASRSSSPYRHSRCMSPFRSTGKSFSDTRKETENLRANRLNKHIRNISRSQELLCPKGNGSTSFVLEKMLYVNTETNDEHKSNVMIFPEEADKAETKPDGNLEVVAFENIRTVNGDELGKTKNGPDRCPLAPPSPKKPSESWLLHNLPSVTSQIHSRRHMLHPQKQEDLNEKSLNNVTKWETIVKTSYMHRDHIRYSNEMVAHTSLQ